MASALAAGRLLGLDEDGLVRAQGAALSMAGGSLQFIEDGAWTKRFHPGWAALAAITAAMFAAHGIDAPAEAYEGRYGFYRLYMGEAQHAGIDLSLGTAGLSANGQASTWETENVAIKPFPVCHFIHASADAAIALRAAVGDPARIARPRRTPLARRAGDDPDARGRLPAASQPHPLLRDKSNRTPPSANPMLAC